MGILYIDRDRLDIVKEFRQSNLGLCEFVRQEKINRSTLKDCVAAYNHLEVDLIGLDNLDSIPGTLIGETDMRLNMLKITKLRRNRNTLHALIILSS